MATSSKTSSSPPLSPETIERKQQQQRELDKNPLIPKSESFRLGTLLSMYLRRRKKEENPGPAPVSQNPLLTDPEHPKNDMFRKFQGSMHEIDRITDHRIRAQRKQLAR